VSLEKGWVKCFCSGVCFPILLHASSLGVPILLVAAKVVFCSPSVLKLNP
jgi:hypothetical protein